MDEWYYINSTRDEVGRGLKVAMLTVPGKVEVDRVIVVEDPKKTDYPSGGLTKIVVRSLKDPKKRKNVVQ